MKLASLIDTMGALLEGRASLQETQRALDMDDRAARRVAIYQRFCATHRLTALKIFSHTRQAIEARGGDWAKLADRYFLAHPMTHVEINANGERFCDFLREQGQPLWLVQLADFEWWEWLTQIAHELPKKGIASTVELRPYEYDFCTWIDEQQLHEPSQMQTLVIFWRDGDGDVRRARLSQTELAVLSAMHRGEVVDPSLQETLSDLIAARIILE